MILAEWASTSHTYAHQYSSRRTTDSMQFVAAKRTVDVLICAKMGRETTIYLLRGSKVLCCVMSLHNKRASRSMKRSPSVAEPLLEQGVSTTTTVLCKRAPSIEAKYEVEHFAFSRLPILQLALEISYRFSCRHETLFPA